MPKYSSLTIPKWAGEAMPRAARPVHELWKNIAFLKMREYERQTGSFRERYRMPFSAFEKKALSRKSERFAEWDDYLVWKGLEAAAEKWRQRYRAL